MPNLLANLDKKKPKDIKVLAGFVSIYCRENHKEAERAEFPIRDERLRVVLDGRNPVLCQDCSRLLSHGIAKLLLCPYDPKPMCKKCPTHCYAPGYREKMRRVMKFSGLYLLKHGRLDLMFHYWL